MKNHIYSGIMHKDTKGRVTKKEARERNVADTLTIPDKSEQAAGKHMSMEEHIE